MRFLFCPSLMVSLWMGKVWRRSRYPPLMILNAHPLWHHRIWSKHKNSWFILLILNSRVFTEVFKLHVLCFFRILRILLSFAGRAVASLSIPSGQDKNISSIFPHFPVVSLIFPQIFFIFFLILVFRVGDSPTWEGPGYALVRRNMLC